MLQTILILFAAGAVGGLTLGRKVAMSEVQMMWKFAKSGVRRRNKKWDDVKANFRKNDRWKEVKASYRQNPFWDRTKDVHKSHISDARRKVEEAQTKMKDFKQYDAAKLRVKTWRTGIDKREAERKEKWQKVKADVKERQKYQVNSSYLLGTSPEEKGP